MDTKTKITKETLEKQGLELINEALEKPGVVSDCYKKFHRFSIRNRKLASMQAGLSPIATYKQWQEKGRQVKKGSKAIVLMMPYQCKIEDKETKEDKVFTRFMYRKNWFTLDQTERIDGKEDTLELEALPEFDINKALKKLGIEQEKFASSDGNCQGYAYDNILAINPLAEDSFKTTIHEMAHIVLGHTKDLKLLDTLTVELAPKEVEAETVNYIISAILDKPESSLSKSRGYIQNWLKSDTKEKIRVNKILSAVDKILEAGKN